MSIKLEKISFYYKDRLALDEIDITIDKGESIALIGANGTGKSTFLKLINGLIFSKSGEYRFNGEIIDEKKMKMGKYSKEFHQKIGFVFQNSEVQLFSSTVYDEIAFGPEQMGLSEKEIKTRVEDCMEILNIKDLAEEIPYNLSGGEEKRVAIASVLSMNPEIIVFDEPMNGIDPKGKRFLKDLLIKLNKAGKTIICATHDFQYIDGVFNRAVVFGENHKIIRDDEYEKVIMDNKFLEDNNII